MEIVPIQNQIFKNWVFFLNNHDQLPHIGYSYQHDF